MDHDEIRFLNQNKYIEDKIDRCIYDIERRLDKIYQNIEDDLAGRINQNAVSLKQSNPYSVYSFLTFRAPYIRDFRNFASPANEDAKEIQKLSGSENIDVIAKTKNWTETLKNQLKDAVHGHYARVHIAKLLKQKIQLLESSANEDDKNVMQKVMLIEEQTAQVKAGTTPNIFVPEDRTDMQIDWCAMSAQLTSHHDAQDCRIMWQNSLHWSINDGPWTKEEDMCLISAVKKLGKNNWDLVAEELNSGRLAWQCCARYNQEYAFVAAPVEGEELEKMIEVINLCRIGSFVPWNQVMYFIHYHSLQQVKYQWQKYCNEKPTTMPWTHEEDRMLMAAIKKYGERDWLRISEFVPGRSNKSCRERYMMRLKYKMRALGKWHHFEDTKLLTLIQRYGTNWPLIANHLSERNCHQLRNRYELIKNNNALRIGPIKRRKLYLDLSGQLVRSLRTKPTSEIEVNQRLHEIFSTYCFVDKKQPKSLVCRSVQDEIIHQTLVNVLADAMLGFNREGSSHLMHLVTEVVRPDKCRFLAPCVETLSGYRAWLLQQDYLNKTSKDEPDVDIDQQVLGIVESVFLWPAMLSRLDCPSVNTSEFQLSSLCEKNSKNFYKIRDIQRNLVR